MHILVAVGTIPVELSHLTELTELWLNHNKLSMWDACVYGVQLKGGEFCYSVFVICVKGAFDEKRVRERRGEEKRRGEERRGDERRGGVRRREERSGAERRGEGRREERGEERRE